MNFAQMLIQASVQSATTKKRHCQRPSQERYRELMNGEWLTVEQIVARVKHKAPVVRAALAVFTNRNEMEKQLSNEAASNGRKLTKWRFKK